MYRKHHRQFYVVRTVYFEMKLCNNQRNAQVFLFHFLPYMFRAFLLYSCNAISNLSPTSLQHLFYERGADNRAVSQFSAPTLTMPLFRKHISGHIHAIQYIKCMTFNPFQSNFSATRILPSSYLFWAGKRLMHYL
jgi:hypothetical protein